MSNEEDSDCSSTKEEESPSIDPHARRRFLAQEQEFPENSQICYLDSEITIHCKIEHATRKLWLLTRQWQRLFPPSQWPTRNLRAEWVLRDDGLLRHILPCARRINNLDGIVWRERPNIRGLGGVAKEVYQDPGPFW